MLRRKQRAPSLAIVSRISERYPPRVARRARRAAPTWRTGSKSRIVPLSRLEDWETGGLGPWESDKAGREVLG